MQKTSLCKKKQDASAAGYSNLQAMYLSDRMRKAEKEAVKESQTLVTEKVIYDYLTDCIDLQQFALIAVHPEKCEASYFSLQSKRNMILRDRRSQLYPSVVMTWQRSCLLLSGGFPKLLCGLNQPCHHSFPPHSKVQVFHWSLIASCSFYSFLNSFRDFVVIEIQNLTVKLLD